MSRLRPRMRLSTPRVLGGFAAAWLFWASAISAQTLTEAFAEAYRTNPALQARRAQLEAAQAQLSEARAGWLPSVHLSGGIGSEHIDTSLAPEMGGAELTRTLNPRSIALSVDQPIYDGGQTSASISRANNTILATNAQLHQAEQTLFLSVATAYLDVLLNQSVLELEQHNVAMLRQQLEATRLRQQAGELTPTDVYQAQARLAQAIACQRRAQAQLVQARAAYLRAVGSEPAGLVRPAPLTGLPASLSQALQQADERSPELIQARYAAAAAQDNVRAVRGRSRPSIHVTGEIRHDDEDSIFTDHTDTQRVMLNASVPLYSGGADSARIRQAEQGTAQRMAELDSQRQQLKEAVTAAWEGWQAAQVELSALMEQTRAADAALAGVRAEQRVGARTVLDVLNAQQESLNAQVSVASAEHDQQVAAFRLLAATGQLTADALALGNGAKE